MEYIVKYLIKHGITIATMESCTGGLLASAITDVEGSSAIFKGGFVTYSNEAKVMQGVPAEVIEKHGVYSMCDVAGEMAVACRRAYQTDLGIGVTGTFGNVDPNNADSVPGEVYYAFVEHDIIRAFRLELDTTKLSRHKMKQRVVREIAHMLTRWANGYYAR